MAPEQSQPAGVLPLRRFASALRCWSADFCLRLALISRSVRSTHNLQHANSMAILDEPTIARRVPVWSALSDLFLGRELQDADYRYIAGRLRDSGYSLTELQGILSEEVAPVFHTNLSLLMPTPEMDGWSEDSVRESVLDYLARSPTMTDRLLPKKWRSDRQLAKIDAKWKTVQMLLTARAMPDDESA